MLQVDDKVIPIPNRANYTPFYYRGEVGYQPGERFEVNIFWKKNESDTGNENENGVTVIKEESTSFFFSWSWGWSLRFC
jgi:hypothetical protein